MRVYYNKRCIVIETCVEWALPYWTARRRNDKCIHWEFT
jgi:hypothetical protein